MSCPFNSGPVRFLDKSVNINERENYNQWWQEQINMFGTNITYFVNKSGSDAIDNLYGEDPVAGFHDGKDLIMTLNLNENAIVMQKFGLVADDEVTGFIHIQTFYDIFNNTEPKAGDVFSLSEFGVDRPGGRTGKHFEITERIDQDVAQINPLIGHYVWLIRAKRHDFSFEPNLPQEGGNEQVFDDVREESLSVFDYTKYNNNDDVYGGYV
jgi:hypothetical protein